MEFINLGKPIKIRIGEVSNCYWTTLRTGERIDLSAELGLHYGLSVKTTEGKINNQVVETKQIDIFDEAAKTFPKAKTFLEELFEIKGIGKNTAKDIVNWGTKEKLIEVIALGGSLPFRNDIEIKLRKVYGKK